MEQNPVKRNFDEAAATWDTPPRVKLAGDVTRAVMAQIPFSKDMDILDLGCGTGLSSLAICPHVRSVTGADSSKGMLDVFRQKAEQQGFQNVRTHHLELDASEALPGTYHAVIMNMVLHHVQDTAALLSKIARALYPGGYLAVADLDPDDGLFHASSEGIFHNGFERAELRKIFTAAGLVDVSDRLASEIVRPIPDGSSRSFSIFLMTGRKG